MKNRMIKKGIAFILCMIMMVFPLAGCGNIDVDEWLDTSNLKSNYINDIDAVFIMSNYLENGNGDLNKMMKEIKSVTVYTLEGIALKNSYIKVIKLCQEGVELVNNMNAGNYEQSMKQYEKLQTEIADITDRVVEKQIDALLEAAKRAGVEGADLQKLGIDF